MSMNHALPNNSVATHVKLAALCLLCLVSPALSDNFVIVTNGVVTATRSKPHENHIAAPDNVACGWLYNGVTWTEPPDVAAARTRRTWTAYRFLKRFTAQERRAIITKAKSDDNVADFQLLLTAAQEVISDDTDVLAGMDYLVAINVLTLARKNEILTGP